MIHGYARPEFHPLISLLNKQLPNNGKGGAALTVYYKGKKVVDIWGGASDKKGTPWAEDTAAMSYSTTKGVMSTLIHILVDEGKADYDDPIAKYWPEFAQNGKENITIRQAMCHEAGLYHIADAVGDFKEMYDWHSVVNVIAEMKPIHTPGTANGYHAISYGFLAGGIIEAISGRPFEELMKEKLVDPLGLDGFFIGVPDHEFSRVAKLVTVIANAKPPKIARARSTRRPAKRATKIAGNALATTAGWFGLTLKDARRAFMVKAKGGLDFNSKEMLQAKLPAMNGVFNARDLARMYAALANGGELDGVRIISEERTRLMGKIQNRRRDRVLQLPMRWRLGYHGVIGAKVKMGFGHFGMGGSGAWCDVDKNIAVALTLNSGTGTPTGDMRIMAINRTLMKCIKAIEMPGKYDVDLEAAEITPR